MSISPRLSQILTPPPMAISSSSLESITGSAAIRSLAAQTSLHQCGFDTGTTSNQVNTSMTSNKGRSGTSDAALSSSATSTTGAAHATQFQSIQRMMTLHPVLPWVAYVLEYTKSHTQQSSSSSSSQHKTLVVQDLQTQQVHWSLTWMDLAACLYQTENTPSKLASAAKSLGSIFALEFVDASTLYWSGMSPTARTRQSSSTAAAAAANSYLPPSAYLLVQTSHRCLVLQLRKSPYSDCIVWTKAEVSSRLLARQALLVSHMEPPSHHGHASTDDDKSTSASSDKILPSSNWLPLSDALYLVGCSDGSMQCWNSRLGQVVKSIRGLGSSSSGADKDWITMLHAANPYHKRSSAASATSGIFGASSGEVEPSAAAASQRRRILAVTKKGLAYLMEIEWHEVSMASVDSLEDDFDDMNMMIEIKPPLARFVGGAGTLSSRDTALMEHQLFHYDAHRDWILWLQPVSPLQPTTSKSKHATTTTAPTLLVWNLKLLEKEIMANAVGGGKSMMKPEPTLTMQFSAAPEDSIMTVLPLQQHTPFNEDTVVCAVVSTNGDFWISAASARSRNTAAIPIFAMHLSNLLQSGADLDHAPIVRIHGLGSQPLSDKSMLALATNLGIIILEIPAATGDRHMHLGAGLGTFGKSLLSVHSNSELVYESLDVLKANPYGIMEPKNPVPVYELRPPVHLPMEYQKRSFRLTPSFIPSPSGLYLCLFNPGEFQYEILHLPSLLQRVGQQRGNATPGGSKPLVASGTGIASFAWVGDEDCFAILHAEEWMNEASMLISAASAINAGEGTPAASSSLLAGVTSTTKMVGGAAALVGGATLNLTKAAKSTTMAAATGASKAATMATTTATKTAVSGFKKGAKLATFGVFSKKKKKGGDDDEGMSTMTDDMEETSANLEMLQVGGAPLPIDTAGSEMRIALKRRYVELKLLILVENSGDPAIGNVPAATTSSIGNLTLRGGGQNLPVALFGGPVLCVASQTDGNDAGYAHFYTLKNDETEKDASLYISTGPALPFPDLCVWDDEGVLCAIVMCNRVSIYMSQSPEFVLLGSVGINTSSTIQNAKFIHGVLYCCSWHSVSCVILGDLDGQVCDVDCYMLTASSIQGIPDIRFLDGDYHSLSPSCRPLPLVQPAVLGYQNGSLLISTARGVFALPLDHPILRIGLLLASNQVERATKWLDAIPDHDHEPLATFLERRGQVELALKHLNGLSLETIIDMSMRHGFIDRLCEVVEEFGVKGICAVDLGRGYSTNGMFGPERESQSLLVCAAAYLLGHGKVEIVRRLTSELLRTDNGREDALLLATLLLHVNEPDATRLMGRAVEGNLSSDWVMGAFVRYHVLKQP
ncbi:hypothetical protein MPSEU_000038400 [Mayamaea pseudoterrestris]|nr:hypothetical protein MPSEU_000038400 [Mayamaea pseudoterrestris]